MARRENNFSIVFDLEATCWDLSNESSGDAFDPNSNSWKQRHEMEIIEIGAVKVRNFDYKIIDEFQTFSKPILNPILSNFCTNLTTITQKDLEDAPSFKQAYLSFEKWAEGADRFIAWGQYDHNQLVKDCTRSSIKCFSSDKYVNGKTEYRRLTGRMGRGLAKVMKHYNLSFRGHHHRALTDAIATAQILKAALAENNKKNQ